MKAFNRFYFERFEFDRATGEAQFFYSFDKEVFFEEKILFFDANFSQLRQDIDLNIVNNILFHIHLALWISYYKYFPTKDLVIQTGKIDDFQEKFWKKFYMNGLWEFFYRNNFDPSNVLHFRSDTEKKFEKIDFITPEKYLVPIGWGKDSIVSIEILKQLEKKIDLVSFWVNDNVLYTNTRDISGNNRLFVKRIFNDYSYLTQQWYYNGHVPITGIIAFVLELSAYLYQYSHIVLSNEKSANFWNIFWKNIQVNHQYSKSGEFEQDFWEYVKKYISSHVEYFSLLRPFYELKIAEMFAKFGKKYFREFSSCNTNFKIFKDKFQKNHIWYWCLECPKCAFVYAILRPFLTQEETLSIFGKELYEDTNLEELFRELLWISWIKPFECVGTNEEVVLAMKKSVENWSGELPFILQIFQKEVLPTLTQDDFERLENQIMKWDFENDRVPKNLKNYLQTL